MRSDVPALGKWSQGKGRTGKVPVTYCRQQDCLPFIQASYPNKLQGYFLCSQSQEFPCQGENDAAMGRETKYFLPWKVAPDSLTSIDNPS